MKKNLEVNKIDETVFNKIRNNIKGKGLTTSELLEVIPKEWNHYKREYVARVSFDPSYSYDGLKRTFISKRRNFSSSGANAELVVDRARIERSDLIEVKDGSHKNMYKKIYTKYQDKWYLAAVRKCAGDYFGGGNKGPWEILSE